MSELLAGLFLGLASSLHCAAMCGPITLALHGPGQPASGRRPAVWSLVAIHHAGRVSMYAAAGLVAGGAGHVVTAMGAGRVLAWTAGVLLLVTAATHLGVGPALPGVPLARMVGRLARTSRSVCAEHPVAGALAGGILHAWLPCGMVYAALTGAAALGRPGAGVAFMALFGLGTVPALAAVWLLADVATPAIRRGFRFGTPVALAIVGLLLIARGYAGSAPETGPPAGTHGHGHGHGHGRVAATAGS